VDVEFTAQVQELNGKPQVQITLIQCRPLETIKESVYLLPQNVPQKDKDLFGAQCGLRRERAKPALRALRAP